MGTVNIAGAGLTGAVIAQQLVERNSDVQVNVYETRSHIGGNCHDSVDYGMRIHKYGPHLLHFNSDSIYEYLSRFCTLVNYEHRVRAILPDDSTTPMPPNRETFAKFGSRPPLRKKTPQQNADDVFFNSYGDALAEVLFRPYTKKMWNRHARDIEVAVGKRLESRLDSDDSRYFTDRYQVIPLKGYTSMIESMLDHPRIKVQTDCDDDDARCNVRDLLYTCQPIDSYFNYVYGKLPYRSLNFTWKDEERSKFSSAAAVFNFTTQPKYTRMTVWERIPHDLQQVLRQTDTLKCVYEEPCEPEPNDDSTKFYPVVNQESKALYKKYKSCQTPFVRFVGRLGRFQYIDMAPAIQLAMKEAEVYVG